jgi:2-oxoisovalerate ferredoxin oxidoreductase beta subunit
MKKIVYQKPSSFFSTFERRPGQIKSNMHYCGGCGHGILHKLIAEAISDFKMEDNTIMIWPVGCSVFGYYYFNVASISVPHGRAPAVATGIARACPEYNVISYQGDGDLGAIGLNEFIQAANRGENMAVFFVNNAIYGMTGGQMAPTTLPDQKTQTSPYGRNIDTEGYPLKVCEMTAALDSPIYVERVALNNPVNIRKARAAVRKALNYMIEKKGFSLVEFLSSCPINLKMSPTEADKWIEEKMIPYFPLGEFKNVASGRTSKKKKKPIFDVAAVEKTLFNDEDIKRITIAEGTEPDFLLKIRCAGFGGQGILSLGLMIAEAAHHHGFNATWLPSYGPEMRGGTANCSIIISSKKIPSPIIDNADIIIVFSQQSMDKFYSSLEPDGIIIYDENNVAKLPPPEAIPLATYSLNASEEAKNLGDARIANTVTLGILSQFIKQIPRESFVKAIRKIFAKKEKALMLNLQAFEKGESITLKQNNNACQKNNSMP